MSENQWDQSMDISTLREKMAVTVPFIRPKGIDFEVADYPFTIDPLMAGDATLASVCRLDEDNFELEMLPTVIKWIAVEEMQVRFSVFFGIFYFKTDEDKVKFILKWL